MPRSLATRLLLAPLAFLPIITGCQLTHPTPTIPVLVRDAETKEPIAGAEVQLWLRGNVAPTQTDPRGVTGADGLARITADLPKNVDILVHVTAPDHMPDATDLVLAGKVAGAPAGGGIIEMYSGPRPVVELVVPTEFQGELKVEVKVLEDAKLARQRKFRYAVPSVALAGLGAPPVVHVVGGPVFEHGQVPEFRGLFANGTPMPTEPKDNEVVLRWVRSEGLDQYFVVGTKIDAEAVRRAAEKTIGSRDSGGGGGGGKSGGGGGGRRGGGGGGGGGSGF